MIRIAGGAASVPYLAITGGDAETVAGIQTEFQEAYGYTIRTASGQKIAQVMGAVGQYAHQNYIAPVRNYSEDQLGLGATAILFATGQVVTESIGLIYTGGAMNRFMATRYPVTGMTPDMLTTNAGLGRIADLDVGLYWGNGGVPYGSTLYGGVPIKTLRPSGPDANHIVGEYSNLKIGKYVHYLLITPRSFRNS